MCGFFGVVFSQPKSLSLTDLTNPRLQNRGPDSNNLLSSTCRRSHVLHYRLAINDLSSAANQPFTLSDYPESCLVFNGEVYNFRELSDYFSGSISFCTSSDTEVLYRGLYEFGPSFLDSISGPFSLAFIDINNDSMLLARDRFGEKPLFYKFTDSAFVYGSDLLQVACYGVTSPKVSRDASYQFCRRGFSGQSKSFFDNVFSLPPGHLISFDLNAFEFSISRFYDITLASSSKTFRPSGFSDKLFAVHSLRSILTTSIERQLNSDRASCMLLSGGLDSSIIASIASSITSDLSTYTVKFTDIDGGNESEIAALLSSHLGTRHKVLDIGDYSLKDFDNILLNLDSPISDPSIIPSSLVYKAISSEHTVVLTGDGADELFGGYYHYSRVLKLLRFNSISSRLPILPDQLISFLSTLTPRASKWLTTIGRDLNKVTFNPRFIFQQSQLTSLLQYEIGDCSSFIDEFSPLSLVRRQMILDINNYLSAIVLPKTDRASMMHSIEVRCPYLDEDVVNFSLSLPDSLLATSSSTKVLLNDLADLLLPSPIRNLQLRKYGFSFSVDKFFRMTSWISHVRDSVYDSGMSINQGQFEKLIDSHINGSDHGHQLFVLLMISRWSLLHDISFDK